MPAQVFLHGFGLSGYRSIGPKLQRLGPFGSINLFAGANNCGKSNVLRFIQEQLPAINRDRVSAYSEDDKPLSLNESLSIEIAFRNDSQTLRRQFPKLPPHLADHLSEFLRPKGFTSDGNISWMRFGAPTGNNTITIDSNFISFIKDQSFNPSIVAGLCQHLAHYTGGSYDTQVRDIIQKLDPRGREFPDVKTVTAFRVIDAVEHNNPTSREINGRGLILELAKLEQHLAHRPDDGKRFLKIQEFFRAVMEDSSARIRIPHDRNTIAVHMNGRDLNLPSLGTGIHQTILLAAMGTVIENSIVCIEEPETHLHPILQRKLLRYLARETSNQYFIATHSAHLLDAIPDATVFRVRLENGWTAVDRVASQSDRWSICQDLGYRASDLVQANCIIWVEGPSDRIYLNHWIRSQAPDLIEGIHYSIMFYGGRLLSHLTGLDEEAVSEFIQLPRLNRNMAILIDSDKKNSAAPINATKQRICDEFAKAGLAWVTNGRTIENYVRPGTLQQVFQKTHGREIKAPTRWQLPNAGKGRFCKMKLSKAVADLSADLDVLDLRERINELVTFIHKANPDQVAQKAE